MPTLPPTISATRRTSVPAQSASIGPWILDGLIARTERASVYRARHGNASSAANILYAVKVLDSAWQDDPLTLAFFRREAQIGRRVSHPHLVSILSAQLQATPYYLVMPYLSGETLQAKLMRQSSNSSKSYSLGSSLWTVRQVAEALVALHDIGCLHGDVKPANVLVSANGHATLLDLGFAREVQEAGGALDRPLIGTIEYLAPELLTSTLAAGPASDLYSLGAMFYEMLAGRVPFPARSLEELVEQQQRGKLTDIRSLAPQIPTEVADLIRELLAKNPDRRPSSIDVVRRLVAMEIGQLGALSI
ncbi:MAG: serine/threonine-protein kinase [Planctomycetota bacterium]|nr:serine/threonine-protein kinase [Planctomycetota bacterium]